METLLKDIRYAVRMLLKRPSVTAIAVLSLALGIGANTTIYSLIYSVLLRPLAVEEPERLVAITNDVLAYPAYRDFRDRNDVFSGLAASSSRMMSLNRDGQPELISGEVVSGNFFDVLGVKTAHGRAFLPEEDQTPGTHPVAVLSYALWQRSFGGDKDIVGKAIRLNGQSFNVIGIAPREFKGARLSGAPTDLWVPIHIWPQVATEAFAKLSIESRGWGWLSVVGRLKPGVTQQEAESALNALASQQEQAFPRDTRKNFHVTLHSLTTAAIGIKTRSDFLRFIGLLVAVVAMALVIACANVANLLLVRGAARRKEIAVRLALGATRSRIVRQMLTESVLLSLVGGAVGLLVAVWAIDILKAYELPGEVALAKIGLGINSQAFGFTFILSLATGIVFGLAPALQASKPDLVSSLKDQAASHASGRSFLRSALVSAQVALCLLMLVGAGLFIKSLRNALAIDPGFNPDNVALASVNLGLQRYTEAQAASFYKELAERIESLPRTESASWARIVPVSGDVDRESFEVSGYQPQPGERMVINTNVVGANYFRTMSIPVVEGREFSYSDQEGAPGVVIVNEEMARHYWPGQSPVGRSLKIMNTDVTVIGVAKNSMYQSLSEDPLPYLYLPLAQRFAGSGLATVSFVVRAKEKTAGVFAAITREASDMDPALPVFNTETLNDHIGDLLKTQRFAATLLSLFSLLALTLSVIGIYGVVAYSVSQRTKEIGIRIALGARQADILRMVIGQGVVPILIGMTIGLGAAYAVTRIMTGFLYGMTATDSATFFSASLVLAVVGLVACAVPAGRATKVDPMVALRYE